MKPALHKTITKQMPGDGMEPVIRQTRQPLSTEYQRAVSRVDQLYLHSG